MAIDYAGDGHLTPLTARARRVLAWLDTPEALLIPGTILVLKNSRLVTWRLHSRFVLWRVVEDRREIHYLN